MTDYQDQATQEAMRSPKNRFLGLFCHANDVGESWGYNWPFYCGVIMFSVLVFIMAACDVYYTFEQGYFTNDLASTWFKFLFVCRLIADVFAFVSIFFGIKSIRLTDSRSGAISYYAIIISLLLNTIFCIYCIIHLFVSNLYSVCKWRLITFFLQEPILFLFAWVLFCNMVEIARKIKRTEEGV